MCLLIFGNSVYLCEFVRILQQQIFLQQTFLDN